MYGKLLTDLQRTILPYQITSPCCTLGEYCTLSGQPDFVEPVNPSHSDLQCLQIEEDSKQVNL